jgi:8-oxo-dGTP pyrophosphatase MutT (NUDIX family)
MSVREDEVVLPDGQPGLYGVVDKPDFALVVPREDDGSVWLVEQYRYPVGKRSWEFPQGSWPAGATGSAAELAAAELREETDLRAAAAAAPGAPSTRRPAFCSQRFECGSPPGLVAGPPQRGARSPSSGMRARR